MGKHLPSDSQLHTFLSLFIKISPYVMSPLAAPIVADSQATFPLEKLLDFSYVVHNVCTLLIVTARISSKSAELVVSSLNKKLISLGLHDLDEASL